MAYGTCGGLQGYARGKTAKAEIFGLAQLNEDMKAFIFDTETTGLIDNRLLKVDKQSEIVEFYGALVDLGTKETLSEVHSLFCPKTPMPTEKKFPNGTVKKIKINGWENSDLVGQPPFATKASEIREAIESAPLVIAHNLSFDRDMVDLEFERLKAPPINWPQGLCTVEQTNWLKGMRLSLTKLHTHLFGEAFKDAHKAKMDSEALIRCCCELYERGWI